MYEGRSKLLMERVYAVKGESGFCRVLVQEWMLAPCSQPTVGASQTTEETKINFRAPVIPNHCYPASAGRLDLAAHMICCLRKEEEEGSLNRWGNAVGEDIDTGHLFNGWPQRRLYRPGRRLRRSESQ
jgi:hypothetical protein